MQQRFSLYWHFMKTTTTRIDMLLLVWLQFWNIMIFSDFRYNNVVLPILDDWILSRQGVVRQETWSYITCCCKCSIHYAYRNCKDDNVKQYLMLKYNNTESSQWLQDISLVLSDWFSSMFFYLQFRWVFHTFIFVHFNIIEIFNLPVWFPIYVWHSPFQLQMQEIDR